MIGAAYATNMAGFEVAGVEGWRFAFRTVAAVAVLIGYLTLRLARDPDYMAPDGGEKAKVHMHAGGLRQTLAEFKQVCAAAGVGGHSAPVWVESR
jgi:predicted MFS family arabinose efflux permease